MEPKDLKNSDELKSTPEAENNNSDINVTRDEENIQENVAEEQKSDDKSGETDNVSKSSEDDEEIQTESQEPAGAITTPDTVADDNTKSDLSDENSMKEIAGQEDDAEEKSKLTKEHVENVASGKKEEQMEDAASENPEEMEEEADSGNTEQEVKDSISGKQEESMVDEDAESQEEEVKESAEESQEEKEDKRETGKKKEKQSRVSAQKVSIPQESSKFHSGAYNSTLADYSKLSLVELINTMRSLLNEAGEKDVKREIESIKAHFYKKLKEDVELQKKKFIEEGGNEDEFESEESPYENDIKELLKEYRQIRIEYNKKLEQEKEVNLQVKYEVIEEIKSLIHKEESINKTFQEFRELQRRWREIGLVPQSKVKDLWDTYHFHVENFYDYIKINQELRDLDLKKNLEIKIRLCEQAEELLLEPNVIRAFNSLQKLHERWRETGPVPRENKDDIWERFKSATNKINKKHQEYFEQRKAEQRKNLEAKRAICEQIEEINETELTTHKEWSEKSKEVINFQKVWRTIGFAPQKDNNKIYTRFRTACDRFFDAKREFYAQNKELQQNNLQLKTDLCVQAESIKDSTDWRKATNELINIQKQWKEIGPVPRKQSDILWKRFRAACDYFFDKKAEHFSNIDTEQVENLKLKEELIEEVTNFAATDDVNKNLEKMKDFQRQWTEIGHVPIDKKDEVQKRFREAIDKLFDDLNIDEAERNLLRFKTKMATFSETNRGHDKMRMEREKYVNKLKQLETDLILLDNNIGFFAKSKKTESLIKDVKRKIEQTKNKIEFLKEKIRVIDEMEQSDD